MPPPELAAPARLPSFAWILNLDAELELSRPGYVRSAKLAAQLEQYVEAAAGLLGPSDVVVRPGKRFATSCVGRAWCPTPRAIHALKSAGVEPENHPTEGVLRAANHRRFSFDLGGGPKGSAYVTNRSAFERAIQGASRHWLLKRPLSFAGRGQLRVRDEVSPNQWSWIEASLRVDGLLVEPLVVLRSEFALHGFIQPDGAFELGQPCVQVVSARGVWKSTRLAISDDLMGAERQELLASSRNVAEALVRLGYFGPFGVDAYRYELDGEPGFCALSEINARYSMGFAVGFLRRAHELSFA